MSNDTFVYGMENSGRNGNGTTGLTDGKSHSTFGGTDSHDSVFDGSPGPTEVPLRDISEGDAHSPYPRKRDAHDNRVPYTFAFSHPTVDDAPLSDTALPGALRLVAERMPGRAAILEHYYTNRLLVARRRLLAVRAQEDARRLAHNAWAEVRQQELDGEVRELNAQKEKACADVWKRHEALVQELEEAHHRAAELTARTGGVYDPEAPSADAVLRHGPSPLEVFAAGEQLPYEASGSVAMLSTNLSWGFTCVIGIMTGLSVGLMAHLLEADALMQKPLMVLLCTLFGIASAIFGKCAVGYSFRYAAERYYLGRPPVVWVPFVVLGALIGLALTLLDATVERAGLLSIRGLENAVAHLSGGSAGGDGDSSVYLLAAVLVTFGYVLTAGWEGYTKGRTAAVLNRLLARQRADYQQQDTELRSRPEVQEALQAVAQVLERQRELRELDADIARLEAPFAARLSWLEARRPVHQEDLTDTARRRIEDAVDNFEGCQALFDRQLDHALAQCEPMYGWWERIVRAVLGYQEPVRRDREHRFWTRFTNRQ